MSGGEIAAIIAASAFALFVVLSAIPLLKLGRLLDETTDSVRELTESTAPLLTNLNETVVETNKQLVRIDVITENVASVTENISSLVGVFTSSVGSPLVRIAGYVKSLSTLLGGKK